MDNAYLILDLEQSCTNAEVRSAFRRASLLVHPDHYPDDPLAKERFELVASARDVLLDPASRSKLDQHLVKVERLEAGAGGGTKDPRGFPRPAQGARPQASGSKVKASKPLRMPTLTEEEKAILHEEMLQKKQLRKEHQAYAQGLVAMSPFAAPLARRRSSGKGALGSHVTRRSLGSLPAVR
eukprot:TRINITY_DN31426_c0_g1_i1.p1 TRINITY_DN31426_c0_g1~~TRINITY_DN31426_c0_g1_i1.p1  ORF type:complete len:182 (-),score=24.98 TRINITY_DN31426_c0_g1_i1:482-1027(-)